MSEALRRCPTCGKTKGADAEEARGRYPGSPSVAANDKGDALVTWAHEH